MRARNVSEGRESSVSRQTLYAARICCLRCARQRIVTLGKTGRTQFCPFFVSVMSLLIPQERADSSRFPLPPVTLLGNRLNEEHRPNLIRKPGKRIYNWKEANTAPVRTYKHANQFLRTPSTTRKRQVHQRWHRPNSTLVSAEAGWEVSQPRLPWPGLARK